MPTWNLIHDLDYSSQPDTLPGGAGSSGGGGFGGILTDCNGGVWSVSGGALVSTPDSVDINTLDRDFLSLPAVERHRDQRLVITTETGSNGSNLWGAALRYDPATGNHYRMLMGRGLSANGDCYMFKRVGGVVTPFTGPGEFTSLSTPYDPSHRYDIDCQAVGNNPTTLSVTVTDLTTSLVVASISASDSAGPLQSGGLYSLDAAANPTFSATTPYHRIRSYSAATLGVSPGSLTAGSSGNPVVLTGTDTGWSPGTPGSPLFAAGGVAGVTVTGQTVTSATSAVLSVDTSSSTGTEIYNDPSSGTSAGQAIVAGTMIPVTDARWRAARSPYNWFEGEGFVRANNFGAYIRRLPFTGTGIGITVDVSAEVAAGLPPEGYPIVAWSIDGAAYQTAQLASTSAQLTLATGLAAGTPELSDLVFVAGDGGVDRWSAQSGRLQITGITLDSGSSLGTPASRPKRMIVLGDSIAETAVVDVAGHGDGRYPYPVAVAAALDCEYGICAFGGLSWDASSSSGVPRLPDSWDEYFSGESRLIAGELVPLPDYALIQCGHNGSPTALQVANWLPLLRAAAGAACQIGIVVPLSRLHALQVSQGYNDYQTATPDPRCRLIDLGSEGARGLDALGTPSLESYDGLHPDIATAGRIGAAVAREWQRQISSGIAGSRRRAI
jgi:hypothetical protein